MNIARLQNGDLYFNEWSLTVPLNIWTQIARGEIGRPAVSELLNISFYKAERLIAAIRSDDHPAPPSVDISGVTASDYVPDFDSVYERAVQNFQRKDDHERRRLHDGQRLPPGDRTNFRLTLSATVHSFPPPLHQTSLPDALFRSDEPL